MGNSDMVSERWPHSAWWCFDLTDYPLHSDRGDLMAGVGSLFHNSQVHFNALQQRSSSTRSPDRFLRAYARGGVSASRFSGHIPTYALVYIRLEEGNFHIS